MKSTLVVFAYLFSIASFATTMTFINDSDKNSKLVLSFKNEAGFQIIEAVPHARRSESLDAFLNLARNENTWLWISVQVGTSAPIVETYCHPRVQVKDMRHKHNWKVTWNGMHCAPVGN